MRSRLLLAFALVSVPPVLLLSAGYASLVSRSFGAALDDRLDTGAEQVQTSIATLRGEVEDRLGELEEDDLPHTQTPPEADRTLAEVLGGRHNLPALTIVDGVGRIVSSRQWPAGYGLPEDDTPLGEDLRLCRVAAGYASTLRLALMPSRTALLRGSAVTVRGGVFLDRDLLQNVHALTGLWVAFRDVVKGRWIAPSGFPLEEMEPRLSGEKGEARAQGTSYRYVGRLLTPALGLVVAAPRTPLDELEAGLRRYSLSIVVLALAFAVLASLVLAGRVARPVRALAEGARRVADGDLREGVEVTSGDEIGALALAFNAMLEALRSSQDRLLQAERVAAWREMARRLAHELKNPLFPIQLSIETLRRAFERGAEGRDLGSLVRDSTGTILDEIAALKRIIDEFSEFARTPKPRLVPMDLNALVDSVLALYRPRAQGVAIETDLEASLPPIEADRDLLHKALANLVANALEAMPGGGRLRLTTRSSAPGAVSLEVADTGPGLSAAEKARLFTPYYTTKAGGTGLGLAIVQGIVSDHLGRVEVESVEGAGTRFTLVLPLRRAAEGVRSSSP
jgi:signal transduction histidine kinase